MQVIIERFFLGRFPSYGTNFLTSGCQRYGADDALLCQRLDPLHGLTAPRAVRAVHGRRASMPSELWWPRGKELAAVDGDRGCGRRRRRHELRRRGHAGRRSRADQPSRVKEAFRANVPVALQLAKAVGRTKLNVFAGHELPGMERMTQLELAAKRPLCRRCRARARAARGPDRGGEHLRESVPTAVEHAGLFGFRAQRPATRTSGCSTMAYHMQRMEGDLTQRSSATFGADRPCQIADSPVRGRPGTGEINLDYVLARLQAASATPAMPACRTRRRRATLRPASRGCRASLRGTPRQDLRRRHPCDACARWKPWSTSSRTRASVVFGIPGAAILPLYDALRHPRRSATSRCATRRAARTPRTGGRGSPASPASASARRAGGNQHDHRALHRAGRLDPDPLHHRAGEPTDLLHKEAFQAVDIVEIAQPVSKWAYQVKETAQLRGCSARRSASRARAGRGPC